MIIISLSPTILSVKKLYGMTRSGASRASRESELLSSSSISHIKFALKKLSFFIQLDEGGK